MEIEITHKLFGISLLMIQNLILENTVFVAVALTILLVLVLVSRVVTLYKHERDWFRIQSQLLSSEAFRQLKHFTSHHLLNIKELNGELSSFRDQPEKRKLVALYLIGAAEYLGKQQGLNASERKILAYCVLEKDIKVSQDELSALYVEAKCLKEESNKQSIKMGARALGHWLKKGTSNQNLGLQALVN